MNTPTEEKLLHTIALTMTDTQGDEYMHALADAIAAGLTIDQIRDYTQHTLRGGKINPDTATQVQETLADDRDCIIPQAWADTIKATHDAHRGTVRDTLDATTYEDQPGHVTIDPSRITYLTGEQVQRIGYDIDEGLSMALPLATCGATIDQVNIWAQVASRGMVTREDLAQLRRHGIRIDGLDMDPSIAPTDAEVEAAARAIWHWYVGESTEGFGKPTYAYDTEKARETARAALAAARKASGR